MLVMPATDVNFQAYAENIAGDFFSKGVPLADGVVKTAKEHDFTPEEVKRLVEKTNTAASIHLLKTADDRKATFTLANLDLVLQRTHPIENPVIEKAAVYKGIPFTRQSGEITKAAADENIRPESSPTIEYTRALATLEQELESRKLEKVALENAIQKKINGLAHEFATLNGPDFQKYASDCYALYGNNAKPVIEALSDYLCVPFEKDAEQSEPYIIDDTTPNLRAMSSICKGLEKLIKLGSEIDYLEKIRTGVISGAKRVARL